MNFEMTTYEFIAVILTIIGLCWAWNKYLCNKIENGDSAVLGNIEKHSEKLHERISKARDEMVPRTEHEKEMKRIYDSMEGLRTEVVRSSERTIHAVNAQAARVDQLLMAVQKRSTDDK